MNNIIDPVNGNSYDIFSFEGKNLLKNYVKAFQTGGGSFSESSSRNAPMRRRRRRKKYHIESGTTAPKIASTDVSTTDIGSSKGSDIGSYTSVLPSKNLKLELENEKVWCNKRGNILERPYCKCINSNDPNGRDENGKLNCKGPFLGITRKLTPHKKIVKYHKATSNRFPSF